MRELREQMDMSQAELAARLEKEFGLKLDASAIARIENNGYPDRPARVIRLGEAYAISYLLKASLEDMVRSIVSPEEMITRASVEVVKSTSIALNADITRADSILQILRLQSLPYKDDESDEASKIREGVARYIAEMTIIRRDLGTLYSQLQNEYPNSRTARKEFFTQLRGARQQLDQLMTNLSST